MSNKSTKNNYIYKYKHTEISTLQVKVHIDHYKVSLNIIWFKQKHHLERDYIIIIIKLVLHNPKLKDNKEIHKTLSKIDRDMSLV